MTAAAEDAAALVDERADQARTELEALVRIPSISIDPDHTADVHASADATVELLRAHGLENVRISGVEGSHPYVIGEWLHAGVDQPTVLLYAHHDVQPPGIVENWTSDPFVPVERDGRLYGRGVADDKAGAVAHAHAVSAWLQSANGALPCNVRVLVEGEEEIGSPTLQAFLHAHLEELRSDVLVLADAGNWKTGVPGLTCSLRGLAAADVEVRALEGPVHSGMAGGAIPDPVMGLARMLSTLVDEYGDVAIDGIWDDVVVDEKARAPIPGFDDRPERFAREFGVREGVELVGNPDSQLHERIWSRPTLTVIGFDGHPIKGSSNQIVARARARLSLRLAPGQDPDRVIEQLRAHLEARVPWGLEFHFRGLEGAPAWQTDPHGPAFDAAKHALRAGFGVDPVLMGVGGSIPFVGPFADAFGGIPALLVGPNDPGNGIHGEDESLHLGDWYSLIRSEVHLLAELAR